MRARCADESLVVPDPVPAPHVRARVGRELVWQPPHGRGARVAVRVRRGCLAVYAGGRPRRLLRHELRVLAGPRLVAHHPVALGSPAVLARPVPAWQHPTLRIVGRHARRSHRRLLPPHVEERREVGLRDQASLHDVAQLPELRDLLGRQPERVGARRIIGTQQRQRPAFRPHRAAHQARLVRVARRRHGRRGGGRRRPMP